MSEYVLVSASDNNDRTVYHQPAEDEPDEPDCHAGVNRDVEWIRKDPSVLPNRRECKDCAGLSERPTNEGPSKLANKLADPDFGPEDAGLSPRGEI